MKTAGGTLTMTQKIVAQRAVTPRSKEVEEEAAPPLATATVAARATPRLVMAPRPPPSRSNPLLVEDRA